MDATPAMPTPEQSAAAFEQAMVNVFGDLAEIFGNPRSHGRLYGVLFASSQPLLMEDIAKRADVSMAAASIGLRALEELGVIERKANGRTGSYTARYELKTLVTGFINQRLLPKLKKSSATLREAANMIPCLQPPLAKEATWKLQRVTQWHTRAEQFLPLAEQILQYAHKFLPKDGRK